MKARKRTFIVVLFLMPVVAAACMVLYLRSERFQELARATVVSRLEQSTDLACKIGQFRFDVFRLRFLVKDLELYPQQGGSGPVRLSVGVASGSFSPISLLRTRIQLPELTIVRLRVTLATAEGASQWNPEGFLRAFRKSLDIVVGKITIREGWVELNDRRVPFDVTLDDFVCDIAYRERPPGYQIHLAYRNGRLVWAGRDVSYDLNARAHLMLEGLDFQSIEVRCRGAHLSGEGKMREWSSPVLSFRMEGVLAAEDLSLFDSGLRDLRGNIPVGADFQWDSNGFHSTGRFSMPAGNYRATPLSVAGGTYEIRNDVLALRDVSGRFGNGRFQAGGTLQLRSNGQSPHRAQISLKQVVLRDASEILELPELALENTMDCVANISWRHDRENLDVTAEVELHEAGSAALQKATSTALVGSAKFRLSSGLLDIYQVSIRSPDTDIKAAGQGRSRFHMHVSTKKPAEVVDMVERLSRFLGDSARARSGVLELVGSYRLDGDVRIEPPAQLSYQGVVEVTQARFRSLDVDKLSANASWNGRILELSSLEVWSGSQNARGRLTIQTPEEKTQAPLVTFEGTVHDIRLSGLGDFGMDLGEDISGTLNGTGALSNARGYWEGKGRFQVEKGNLREQPFDRLEGEVELGERRLRISEGQLTRGPSTIILRGEIDRDTKEMNLTARLAKLPLSELPLVSETDWRLRGEITASGEIRGTPDNPVVKGSFDLEGLQYESWNLGRGKGQVTIADKVLEGNLDVQSELGRFRARARIRSEDGYPGVAHLEFRDWNLQKIISGNIPPFLSELSTALEGRVDVEGRFGEPVTLSYRGEMDGARFKIQDYELRNAGRIQFSASNQMLHVEPVTIVGEGTNLILGGDIPVDGSPTLILQLVGDLDLRFLQNLDKKARASGSVGLNVRATQSLRDPQVIGQATLKSTRLEYSDLPFHFSSLRGNIVFSRNLVRFENVEGTAASGVVQVAGALEHQNAQVRSANLQITGRGMRLPYPKEFRTTADADLVLKGVAGSNVLAGDIRVIRAEYLREFSLLEQLVGRTTALKGPQTTDPFLAGLRLNITIHADESLYIENELARLRGGLHLTLRGTPAYPSLVGRVEASEGSIFFRGNRFDIIHATADFADVNRINPILDIRAEADVRSYRFILNVSGLADRMNFNIASDPPLSLVDIVSLLTTGKSREPGFESSRRQAEITGLSAASILSESLTDAIGRRVRRIFGIQGFRVDPFLVGSENDPTARVTIVERLSRDLTITFSRNLSTSEEQIVVLEYGVSRNLSVVATRDEDGKFGLDFRFRKRFR